MTWDGSINVGQIINTIVLLSGCFYFVWSIKGKLDLLIQETTLRHESNLEKFDHIDKKLNELVNITVELAKQELRMNHTDERIQELSNRLSSFIRGRAKRSKNQV